MVPRTDGRIILVRHGQTYSNVDKHLDTAPPGAELTDLGREQARNVGTELAEYCQVSEGDMGRLAAVYSSIAIRAQQTAMLAASAIEDAAGLRRRSLPVYPVAGLHEISAGDMEMRNDVDAHRLYALAMSGWLNGELDARMPGDSGENLADILGRYQPVLETIAETHLARGAAKDVIVVSHGAAIRTMAARATGVDPEFAFAGYLNNCRFIVLAPRGREFGRWDLVRWADLDHQI